VAITPALARLVLVVVAQGQPGMVAMRPVGLSERAPLPAVVMAVPVKP
jgi:hypothetical protein